MIVDMEEKEVENERLRELLGEAKKVISALEELRQPIQDREVWDCFHKIELGLDSAFAIMSECNIVVPEDHHDPGAILDCKNNVHDAREAFVKLSTLLPREQAEQSEPQPIEGQSEDKKKDEVLVKALHELRAAIHTLGYYVQSHEDKDAVYGHLQRFEAIIQHY